MLKSKRKLHHEETPKKRLKGQRMSKEHGESDCADDNTSNSVFSKLVKDSGFILTKKNAAYQLSVDQAVFQRNLFLNLKRHSNYPEVIQEVIAGFQAHIDNQHRFLWSLLATITAADCTSARGGNQDSLTRLLLGIDVLQPPLIVVLLEKLAEFSSDDQHIIEKGTVVNLPRLIMSQFRLLDHIVNNKELCEKILEILSVASLETQREIIACLSEIIDDVDHAAVAKALNNLMNERSELTAAILDTLSNLNVSEELLSEIRSSVLKAVSSVELDHLPIVVKFILQSVDQKNALEVIAELRSNLDLSTAPVQTLSPSSARKVKKEDRDCIILTLDAIKSAIHFQRNVGDSWLKVIDSISETSEHKVLDIFILLMLHPLHTRRRVVESLIRNKIRAGHFTEKLLQTAFLSHSLVMRENFSSILMLAGTLLHSPELDILQFGATNYKCSFAAFDTYCQQEVIGALVMHVGSRQGSETDTALNILLELSQRYTKNMSVFAIFVKGILDYLDNLTLPQIRKVYAMLSSLAYNSGPNEGSALQEDMHIIIQKQLSNSQPKYKRMGVIGALMIVKCIAPGGPGENVKRIPTAESLKQAVSTLELVQNSVSQSSVALALFYDELATIIFQKELHSELEAWVNDSVINRFQDDFIRDVEEDSVQTNNIMTPELELGLDGDVVIALNLLPMVVKDEELKLKKLDLKAKEKHVTPLTLASHFRLLRVCEYSQHSGSLDGIDALLGCPIYLSPPENIEKYSSLSYEEKRIVCTTMFYCLNWFREVINAFSTQTDQDLKAKVVKRLVNLVEMQKQLSKCLADMPAYVPPTASFDLDEEVFVAAANNQPPKAPAKRGRKPDPKKHKKGTETQDNDHDASATQTQLNSTLTCKTNSKDKTSNEKDQLPVAVDLNMYLKYFRELDFEVFVVLQEGIVLSNCSTLSQKKKQIKLQPPEVAFLLEDLNRKLEHMLVASASKRQTCCLRAKSNNRRGSFSNLSVYTAEIVAQKAVELLPFLCAHLEAVSSFFQTLVAESDGVIDGMAMHSEEAVGLGLCLQLLLQVINTLLSWNGFSTVEYRPLLKRALLILASRLSSTGRTQTSFEEIVEQAFRYVENFGESVPNFTCAIGVVKLLETIFVKSKTSTLRSKLAKTADTFLKRQWTDNSGNREKGGKYNEKLQQLLMVSFHYLTDPMEVLESVVTVALPELMENETEHGSTTYPTLNKSTFTVYYRVLLSRLVEIVKGNGSDSQSQANTMLSWNLATRIFHVLVNAIKVFDGCSNIMLCLKYGRLFVEIFLKNGMPVLDHSFRNHRDDVQALLKTFQLSTRYLQHMCSHSKVGKNITLMNYVPALKKTLEAFVYRVKAMLVLNKCKEAFWIGNLKNRDLQGGEILSQANQSQVPDKTSAENTDEEAEDLPEDLESDVELDNKSEECDDAAEADSLSETF